MKKTAKKVPGKKPGKKTVVKKAATKKAPTHARGLPLQPMKTAKKKPAKKRVAKPEPAKSPVLFRRGDSGAHVQMLQFMLLTWGTRDMDEKLFLNPKGFYGERTAMLVAKFKEANGLPSDGSFVDQKCMDLIMYLLSTTSPLHLAPIRDCLLELFMSMGAEPLDDDFNPEDVATDEEFMERLHPVAEGGEPSAPQLVLDQFEIETGEKPAASASETAATPVEPEAATPVPESAAQPTPVASSTSVDHDDHGNSGHPND